MECVSLLTLRLYRHNAGAMTTARKFSQFPGRFEMRRGGYLDRPVIAYETWGKTQRGPRQRHPDLYRHVAIGACHVVSRRSFLGLVGGDGRAIETDQHPALFRHLHQFPGQLLWVYGSCFARPGDRQALRADISGAESRGCRERRQIRRGPVRHRAPAHCRRAVDGRHDDARLRRPVSDDDPQPGTVVDGGAGAAVLHCHAFAAARADPPRSRLGRRQLRRRGRADHRHASGPQTRHGDLPVGPRVGATLWSRAGGG